jgi:hypothetical protein
MPGGKFAGWVLAAAIASLPLLLVAQNDDGPILRPHKSAPQPPPAATATLLAMCDLSCNWSLDGEQKGHIEAGASAKAKVGLGQHVVIATTEDGLDRVQQVAEARNSGQTVVTLELKPLRAARLAAESNTTLLVTCDLACNWKLDGESKGHIEAGGSAKAQAAFGDHIVSAATDDGMDSAELARSYKETGQALVRIDLSTVRTARVAAQQKASEDAKAARLQQERLRQKEHQDAIARDTWADPATGLMWTKRDNGKDVNWSRAGEYCRNLRLDSHSDWRLPEIDELQAIYDPSRSEQDWEYGARHYHVKGQLELSGWLWSSSQKNASGKAWLYEFLNGKQSPFGLDNYYGGRALCVRRSGE